MNVLIRLYPREWRERYGQEMASLLAERPATPRLVLDLIAGAIDARVNPQWPLRDDVGGLAKGETTMMSLFAHCQPVGATRAEQWRSVAWMLGGTLVLSLAYIALKRAFGDRLLVDALGVSAFPIALLIAGRETYFKPYSRQARTVIIGASIAIVFLLSLLGASLAHLT